MEMIQEFILWLMRFLPIKCPVCGAKRSEQGWVIYSPKGKYDPEARFVRCPACTK